MARKRFMTKHHLFPVSRFSRKRNKQTITLDWERHHEHWHALFGNLSIFEAIEVLKRIAEHKEIKGGEICKILLIPPK